MRRFFLSGFVFSCLTVLATCQTPEVAIYADFTPTWIVSTGQTSRLRWYDIHGRYSVVGMQLILESGNIVKLTERLEKIDNDGDNGSLDEAYIESRGSWRIGKQYLPFGTQSLLRETVPAVRYDTQLVIDTLPLKIAFSDNGAGFTRGVVARIGDSVGVSVGVGDHFAIQGSSLTQIRRPDEAPGRGRGYERAFGLDLSRQWAGGVLEFEWVSLQHGITVEDVDMDISDLRFRFTTKGSNIPIALAWSREWEKRRDWYSLAAEIRVLETLVWEPFLRFDGLNWHDFGLSAKIKL